MRPRCPLTLVLQVGPAIRECYAAGIDVRMVTGDNLDTAVAIAIRYTRCIHDYIKHHQRHHIFARARGTGAGSCAKTISSR